MVSDGREVCADKFNLELVRVLAVTTLVGRIVVERIQSFLKLTCWSVLLGIGLAAAAPSWAEQAAEKPITDAATETIPKTTVYLVRHTEKQLDAGRDPELTEQGHTRARNWARLLSDVSLDKVYSTDYIRTRDTAKPIAASQNISVQLYDPGSVDFEAFIQENLNSNVVVVGHSNTIPAFANGLLGEKRYEELDESNYDSLFVVDIMGQLRNAKLLNVAAPKSN